MSALPQAAATMPTGTVTFVFTDIEGSTRRWDHDRAAMQMAVRRHDVLMRDAIAAHNGQVFKTIGDAFCAAFARPEDAVASMFDAQRALGAEDFSAVGGLRVRAAIHTGTADERDGDYFGPALNRVARLLGIAHGAQVLISRVSSDLVRGALPPEASLRDLGEHRLKDLSLPEHVFQLVGPSLIDDFPALRSLNAMQHNLPATITSFVGRESEIAEITTLLETRRLLTLVGSGGVGKTRTSLHVAAHMLDGSRDGVWFIELAPLSSGELIPNTVARAMGLTLPADGDQLDHLVRALREKRTLAIFDNCEHLVADSARVIAAILQGCADVTILASSRRSLGIVGEATYRMPPLPTPSDLAGASLPAADAMRYAAISLFAERARAADHRFALSDENAPFVSSICKRLDGIPLAIELAAARVKILSPKQLRDRLDERFRLLTGGGRDLLPRQQTLRALIDWSYDLLEDRERVAFRRLGIFVDGCTLDAACAVASGEDVDALDMLDLIDSLVDKSLVVAEPAGDDVRYRLLESTRAYALEKLREAGERDPLASRHLRYLRDWFVEMYDRQEATSRNAEKSAAFLAELEGVRFALDDAPARADVVAGAELLAAIERAWQNGFLREGIARTEAFLAALAEHEVLLLAKLSVTLAAFLSEQGLFARALDVATQACRYARESGDGPAIAFALRWYALANVNLHDFAKADAALTEAAAIPRLSARLRSSLIEARLQLSTRSGDLDAAALGYEQLIRDQDALGNVRNVHLSVLNLADIEHARGRTARAVALAREVLPALKSGNDPALYASCVADLAGFLATSDDLAGAEEAVREVIATLAPEPGQVQVTGALEHLALVDALQGSWSRAAQLAAYTEAAFANMGTTRNFTEQITRERLTKLLEANVAPEERARFAERGAALGPEMAVSLAKEAQRS